MAFDLVLFGGTGDLTWRKLMPALFQAFRHGKLPEGGRILAVSRQAMSDDEYRAWLKERFQEVEGAKRPTDEEFARFAGLLHYLRLDLSKPNGYGELKAWLAGTLGRQAPADELRPARRGRPERREGPGRAREAARPRPGERARDQPRRALGVPQGAGVSHRPLPRQAGGAEPDGAALRQRPVRAALAARVDRQHPDHARRSHRRRHARRLLQPHRRDPRREAEGAALAQALQPRERRPRRGPRPVPRRHDRRQGGARLPRGRQGAG